MFIFFGFFVALFLIKHLGKILDTIESWGNDWENEGEDGDEGKGGSKPVEAFKDLVRAETLKAIATKPEAKTKQKAQPNKKKVVDFELSDRQESIYQLIRKEGELDMKSVQDKVAGVSDRTLRRDMTKMEKLGLIKQVGKTRNSVYKLKE